MKWWVLQITVFKRLNYLSNCNKQDFKINFKPLFKWTFAQNQCYRFSNDEQLLCSKFFELLHKNGRKSWFPKRIRHFQMHSSFNFYLSNQCSNEKVPKTKVVDLEILNNFGIQKFLFWGQEEGEKLSLQKEILNFELFTKITLTPSLFFLCFLPPSRRSPSVRWRWPPGRSRAAPRPNPPHAPPV